MPHRHRAHARRFASILALASALAGGGAHAQDARDVDRLADLVVEMLPLGRIFEAQAAKDPTWPLQDKAGAASAEQLACMRSELTQAGYRRSKRADLQAYAAANASRVASDVRLLEDGAAALFGSLVMAGADAERTGVEPDPNAVLAAAKPEQLLAFMTFFSDPNHSALRKAAGLGDALGLDKSAQENEAAGQQLGSSLSVQQMIKAMAACKVPTSVLL